MNCLGTVCVYAVRSQGGFERSVSHNSVQKEWAQSIRALKESVRGRGLVFVCSLCIVVTDTEKQAQYRWHQWRDELHATQMEQEVKAWHTDTTNV